MNISGIRPSVGFYDQNSIRFNAEFGIHANEEIKEQAPAVEEESVKVSISDEEIAKARGSQTFGSYDFASQYKPDEVHELKGVDSDIKNLDVEKAVSDMKKDTAIHRYQYFVQNKGVTGEAAQPRATEDFSL